MKFEVPTKEVGMEASNAKHADNTFLLDLLIFLLCFRQRSRDKSDCLLIFIWHAMYMIRCISAASIKATTVLRGWEENKSSTTEGPDMTSTLSHFVA